MKKKTIVMFMCLFFIVTLFPITTIANESDGPNFEDKIRDVLFFGLFKVVPQGVKHIDIVSAWFSEDSNNPEYIYLKLEIRNLEGKTEVLEAIYAVSWLNNNNYFSTGLHVYPSGVSDYYFGISMDENSIIDSYYNCEGSYNSENNVITWIIPKETVGQLQPGDILYDLRPHTHLRFPYESGASNDGFI